MGVSGTHSEAANAQPPYVSSINCTKCVAKHVRYQFLLFDSFFFFFCSRSLALPLSSSTLDTLFFVSRVTDTEREDEITQRGRFRLWTRCESTFFLSKRSPEKSTLLSNDVREILVTVNNRTAKCPRDQFPCYN